jgi:DNA-3-methyladenine glycosylase II
MRWRHATPISRARSATSAIPNPASARAATPRCCAPSSASRSASPPPIRSGTSWKRISAKDAPPRAVAAAEFDALRACGLSGQKQGYAKSLAQLILDGELKFDALPADDEEAIALLTKVKGIGRWSAEIYLLFAEGRPDIWPAGDLAVQEAVGRILQLGARPSEKVARELAEAWRPHRGAAAIFSWHCYNMDVI